MSKIRPDIANRRIDSFRKRFGKAHLYLAYHAAFPSVLTPDLLYRLWANFQRDIHGEVLAIPWVSVADILLSNLCDEVGHELYEIDLAVRKQLLRHLKEDPDFGQQRLDEIANFLLDYIQHQLLSHDPDIQDFAQAQRWTALAYIHPSKAARELTFTLSKLDQKQDKEEILRLASLVETVAEPLAEFESLLVYTRGMASFVRGDLESAATQFSTVFIDKNQIQVAGIGLLVPEQIIKAIGGVQDIPLNQVRKSENKKITSSILKLFNKQLPITHSNYKLEVANNVQTLSGRPNFRTLVFVILVITALVTGIRFLGVLQTLELTAYDQMMRSRPDEGRDSRLLIVAVSEQDLNKVNWPLSGEVLDQVLGKLEAYEPRAIGLDIFRDLPVQPGHEKLLKRLQESDVITPVCKHSEKANPRNSGTAPPQGIVAERVGFSDVVEDTDGVIRRNLLLVDIHLKDPCQTEYSLSLQLALKYLEIGNIQPEFTLDYGLRLRNIVFKPLQPHTGGYQKADTSGSQMLLNYRSSRQIAQQVTITELLSDQVKPELVKDRIVLIGSTAPSLNDIFNTPYTSGKSDFSGNMSGVEIHAHSVSQILSAVLNRRPLLRVWSLWMEIAWIGCWSFFGGILAQRFQYLLTLGLAGGIAITILYSFCFGLLILGYWIPFVPAAFTFVFAGLVVQYQKYLLKRQELLKNNLPHNLASKN